MRLKVTAANWAGASYNPLGILRILRLAQSIRSDEPFYQYGIDETLSAAGIMLDVNQRNWLGVKPQFLEPPPALVDHLIEMSWVVPQSLPIQLYGDRDVSRSALRVGAIPDGEARAVSVFDNIKWGTIAEFCNAFDGAAALARLAGLPMKRKKRNATLRTCCIPSVDASAVETRRQRARRRGQTFGGRKRFL